MRNPTLPLKSKKILVMEHKPADRERVVRCLEIEGYEVLQASSGAEALEGMRKFSPDLIIAALDMPDTNVRDFYRQVHQNPLWVPIPFIFLTNGGPNRELRSQTVLFMEDYLSRPVEPDALLRRVHARLLRSTEIQVAHLDQAYLETVTMLANAIESRDPFTHQHVERVAKYARWLADALDWPPENIRLLEFGARLHDIGKIAVDDYILNKQGPLLPSEWEIIRKHPIAGANMMAGMSHLRDTVPYVRYHHERWDGTGYPDGLQGRDIPIEGRVMAIVDVFDALTTNRPYHPPRPAHEVMKYLEIKAGTQFDPELVEVFLRVLRQKTKSTILVR